MLNKLRRRQGKRKGHQDTVRGSWSPWRIWASEKFIVMWSKDLLESRNVILNVNLFILLQYKLFLSQSLMEYAKQILYMSDLGKIKEKGLYFSNSQCVLKIATSSTSSGNLLEMQILGPNADPLNQKTWVEFSGLCFKESSRWFWCKLKCENYLSYFISRFMWNKRKGKVIEDEKSAE